MAKIVVLGGGESGYGSAVLAKAKGLEIFVSDNGTIAPKYRAILEQWEIEYEQGGHSWDRVLEADLVVKSPGIPDSVDVVQFALANRVPVVSEIELTGAYNTARTICITGSNGKTTTTELTYKILNDAGYNVAIGGNIGESFAYSVATQHYDWYVLELSSFQLDGMSRFKADIAVLMNITPDHLDRYNYDMQEYVDSKMRIVQNQTPNDVFIYSGDDRTIAREMDKYPMPMMKLPFSVSRPMLQGAMVYGGEVICRVGGKEVVVGVDELKIKGRHNLYNVMAATMAALSAGVDPESIVKSLREFEGVEHRLEYVGEWNGVQFINDSKATNVDSAWYALDSMTRPTVWIAGGKDKGNDYEALKTLIKTKQIKALVCMGLHNEKLVADFSGLIDQIVSTDSLDKAMDAAVELSSSGDTILLSPACASFDLFKSYEDRGAQFKAWCTDHLNS